MKRIDENRFYQVWLDLEVRTYRQISKRIHKQVVYQVEDQVCANAINRTIEDYIKD